MTAIHYEVRTFSPDEAAKIIADQGKSDCPACRVAEGYAADMSSRRWVFNGDAVIFSETGILLDGLKRLQAAVMSGVSFRTLVVTDVSDDASATVGTHRRRTMADTLKILGAQDLSAALAKTVVFGLTLAQGEWQRPRKPFGRTLVIATLERHPELMSCVEQALVHAPSRLVTPAVYATALFMLGRVDAEAASTFVALALRDDLPRPEKGLISGLRKRLEGDKAAKRALVPYEIFGIVVKTWNSWRDNTSLTVPKMDKNEAFPRISGWTPLLDLDTSIVASDAGIPLDDEELDIQVERLTILPAEADAMLVNMVPNRLVVASKVAPIKRDLATGSWRINGQTVKFDTRGRLCDGQHRLTACSQSGVPLDTLVVRGLPDSAFATLDFQATRSFKDYLEARNIANASHLAAALRLVWGADLPNPGSSLSPSNSELEACLEAHAGILAHGSCWSAMSDVMQPSVAIASRYLCDRVDAASAAAFFDKLREGDDLSKENPIRHARNHIMKHRVHKDRKRASGGHAEAMRSLALVINTWLSWRRDDKLSNVKPLLWDFGTGPFPRTGE